MSSTLSNTAIRFPKLNNANYAKWVVCMEATLVRRGLWSVVCVHVLSFDEDGKEKATSTIAAELEVAKKKRNQTKMDEACAKLILSVESGQLSHMHSCNPTEIWETPERMHRAAGFVTSLALCCQFLTVKKLDSQPMQAWISVIQGLAFCME
ncbi:hypothetical protein H0H81_011885 [Sphagnurus paluster]|uniref:DUF4219 domain-containing protein n=1 Tax=Sphagnurus paluster TaxID=117069 RepID=A0A9P7KI59_9AGAR|nr:hypothetical protein H0H81_011885 [Sphagnurus paluster]